MLTTDGVEELPLLEGDLRLLALNPNMDKQPPTPGFSREMLEMSQKCVKPLAYDSQSNRRHFQGVDSC